MKWWQGSIAVGLIASTVAVMVGSTSAIAQSDLLTQAEIYKLVNSVQLLLKDRPPRSAQVADVVQPLDAVKTATRARADLVFNEGSLVRLGGNAIFRFVPGSRSFQLRNGTGLFIFPPEDEGGTVVTPEAVVTAQGTTVWVQHNSDKQTTSIGVLTENPQVPVTVTTHTGEGAVVLDAGQRTDVKKGELTSAKNMSLRRFYKVCKLAADLGTETEIPSDSLPPQAQNTIVTVRDRAIAAMENQFRQETDPPRGFEQIVPCTVKEEPKDISAPQDVFQGFPMAAPRRR